VSNRPRLLVPANDFERQWEAIRDDAIAAVDRVGRSGWLVLGDEVQRFEQELAAWWGVPHAVGVGSGLDALEIALRCAGLRPGDRVITSALTAFATTLAIIRAGGRPVWCDVDESGGIDLDQVDDALGRDPSIRAMVPVHLYGHPLDAEALRRVAADREVAVVEDCAQSAGAARDGRPTGTAGIAAGTSLYPTKNLGAMGDGGVLLTSDPAVAERARRLRDYGQQGRYQHVELGMNSRLDELQAAILSRALLPRLPDWLARRGLIAARYVDALNSLAGRLRPIEALGGKSARHLFPVEVLEGDPQEIATRIVRRGVAIGRHYPFVCPDEPAARGVGETLGSALPIARRLAQRELSLPINPFLDDAQIDIVIEACVDAYG
jgi:dTDP-3-amino-3,4,6-trideoxy-alpha-D-glucose transaminase